MCIRSIQPLFAALLLVTVTGTARAATVDHSLYASLLNRFVDDGVVDYDGIQQNESELDRYLDELAAVKPETLADDEQFAFYVNAYNAWTIKLILSRYPNIESIRDIGGLFSSPWKRKIARIDGRLLTLDQIEHDILRKAFADPRVHFAVNCASKGCPPLQAEPFRGDRLQAQLDRATTAFINDPRFNRLENNTLWVSKIFRWFSEDFDEDVVAFFIRYADPPMRDRLEKNKASIEIRHLDYDWSLNGT